MAPQCILFLYLKFAVDLINFLGNSLSAIYFNQFLIFQARENFEHQKGLVKGKHKK